LQREPRRNRDIQRVNHVVYLYAYS